MFNQLKIFAGHFKLLAGPHLARGPDVAQAWGRTLSSGSQPGCGDTLGWHKEVLGVPPILKFQWTFGLF